MLNADVAYLIGLIVGKGQIKRGNKETEVIIDIPHKNLTIGTEDTQLSVRASLLDLNNRLRPLIGSDMFADTSNENVAHTTFSKPNGDFLIRTLNSLLKNKTSWRDFRIPQEIFESSDDIKKEFIRGLADVTGHIRGSNSAFGIAFNHRVYLEIMDNWDLAVDLANLLKSLDIPIHTIRWAHPNLVDVSQEYYNKGIRNYKEHQIKIWAEEFIKVGFNIDHKNKLLKKYADINMKEWDKDIHQKIQSARTQERKDHLRTKLGHIELIHHKYYWETRELEKEKPSHPDENNPRIHPSIRGKHFNNWKDISRELGYHE